MVFAALKDAGQLAEFVPEQARWYIAKKRQTAFRAYCEAEMESNKDKDPKDVSFGGIAPWSFPVDLTDADQVEIMIKQRLADDLMYMTAGPGTTIVTDSSPINSLFYMSEELRQANAKSQTILDACNQTCLFFYVRPIPNLGVGDLLRIHNDNFSQEMDNRIIPTICELLPGIVSKVIPLMGSAEERKVQALTSYYEMKFPQG